MGSHAVLTQQNATQLNLSDTIYNFVNYLAESASQFGENFSIASKKSDIAKAINKDVRTVTRYLKQLEEKQLIKTATKKGKEGGTVIVFNTLLLDFETQENPVTSETKDADEIRDIIFPKAKKKVTKKKYRPKSVIEEERFRKNLRKSENDRLNDLLAEMEFPTKDFFMQTAEPELYYRAYIASRMYNFYAVYYPEMRMNKAEAKNDLWGYKLADTYRENYRYFDCLNKKFIGTPTFNHFIKFTSTMLGNKVKPEAYLTVQFDYMEYLTSVKANNVKLPYINALLSTPSVNRWIATEEYKTGFRKEHHYYAVSPETVDAKGMVYPLMNILGAEFENPFSDSDAYQAQIDVNTDIFMPQIPKAILGYKVAIDKEIQESDLLDNEKSTLTTFIKQETANHMGLSQPTSLYFLSTIPQVSALRLATLKDKTENLRPHYHALGNIHLIENVISNIDRVANVKRGYRMDFSLFGGISFLSTAKTLRDARGFNIDYDVLRVAINKFGARKIPIDASGFLDVNAIQKKVLPQSVIDTELAGAVPVVKDPKRLLDLFGDLWYDVSEEYIGESPRDGKWKGLNY